MNQRLPPGLIALCLLLLHGCAAPPPAITTITANRCPSVSPCLLSPVSLDRNGDLLNALIVTENDWADCAAQVNAIVHCQRQQDRPWKN